MTDKVITLRFLTTGLDREADVSYTTGNGVSVKSQRIDNNRLVSDKAVFDVVKVEIDSVAGADYIGKNTGKEFVYATSQDTGDVVVSLKVEPVGVNLPSDFITWAGGTSGADQLHRHVSRVNLIERGELITATYTVMSIKARVYVFEKEPDPEDVELDITITPDNDIVDIPFGKADFNDAKTPDETYKIYYKDKKWKFIFNKIEYEIKWGIKSGGNTDVPSGVMNPFPNGNQNIMPANSTQYERRYRARQDLTPDSTGRAPRIAYWSSALTIQHENFHIDDWISVYTPRIHEAEMDIETNQEVEVTLDMLNPEHVLSMKKIEFSIIVLRKAVDTYNNYNPGAEDRAYADGRDEYQALASSIVP